MKKLFVVGILLLQALFLFPQSSKPVVINEVMSSNVSSVLDDNQNFTEYIELYNPTNTIYYFNGIYLSNDRNNLLKYKIIDGFSIASKKYVVVWCDKRIRSLHANFKLDPDGGTIYLSNSSMQILDSLKLGKQFMNVAYGRFPDGADSWDFLYPGTPGKTNSTTSASRQLNKVQFDITGGFYSGTQTVRLLASSKARIYYTTNGSEPTESSTLYTDPIVITSTKVIRARAFAAGYIASDVTTQTYFINQRQMDFPVFSISTDPLYLYDPYIGMYVEGKNGTMGMCAQSPVNYNRDWERPVNIEMYDPAKKQQINQFTGCRINGNCSRRNAQKSLAFYPDEKYGGNHFTYPFFNGRTNLELKSLLLRNAGNDWNQSMLRDGFHHTLIQGLLNVDYMLYRPSVVFMNGQYWGIQNIREKHGNDYIWSNYHIDEDSLDVLQNNATADDGTNTHYNNLVNYIKSSDISIPANYNYVCTQMDMDNYLDYVITEMFIVNTDWPGNNISFWHPQRPDGKWRWLLFDTDFGFGFNGKSPTFDMITFSTKTNGASWPNPDWSTWLFRTLLLNDTFKHQFIDRFSIYLGSVFRSDRTVHILDSLSGAIETEMPYHISRWGGSLETWKSNIGTMRSFAQTRPDFAYLHLASFFPIGSPAELELHSSLPGGSFVVNDIVVPDSVMKGKYFKHSFLKIKPLPPSGYKFDHWHVMYVNNTFDYMLNYGSSWRFMDQGIDLGSEWQKASFNDSTWKTGNGEFGYGDFDEKTIIWPGPSFDNRNLTNYFRKKVNIVDTVDMKDIFIDLLIDDGAVVYVNEQEVMRYNMPSGTISYSSLALSNIENLTITQKIPRSFFQVGENIIAVEVHQTSANGEDISFDMAMRYTLSQPGPVDTTINKEVFADTMRFGMIFAAYYKTDTSSRKLLINELCASNNSIKDEFGESDDWIELYNPTDDSVDAGGLFLTNSKAMPTMCRIPAGYPHLTTIAPKSYLRLWLDQQTYQGKLHLGMNLNRMGQFIGICQLKGSIVDWMDTMSLGYQDHLYSFGRYPDGDTSLMFMAFTPSTKNEKGFGGDSILKKIVINEIAAQNKSYADEIGEFNDWIELYNPGSDTVDIAGLLLTDTFGYYGITRIPFGYDTTKIAPKDHRIIWCDNKPERGPLHAGIRLNRMGEQIGIAQIYKNKTIWTDTITYGFQDYNYSYGRYNDGDSLWMYMPMTADSENVMGYVADTTIKTIMINELCAANTSYPDEFGETNDWIELYNPANDTIDIAGMYLTDDPSVPGVARIPFQYPEKTRIAPHGFLLLWCDEEKNRGPLHLDIQLYKGGEWLAITQKTGLGTQLSDSLYYPSQVTGYSYGRFADGQDSMYFLEFTPGAPNKRSSYGIRHSLSSGCSIYPNPTSGILNIISGSDHSLISVYSIQGSKLYEQQSQSDPAGINLEFLPSGLYLIRIITAEQSVAIPFIKE